MAPAGHHAGRRGHAEERDVPQVTGELMQEVETEVISQKWPSRW